MSKLTIYKTQGEKRYGIYSLIFILEKERLKCANEAFRDKNLCSSTEDGLQRIERRGKKILALLIRFALLIRNQQRVFCIIYKHYLFTGPCQAGDVWLKKDGTPFLFWNDKWSPICGHWFWNNQNGALAFCKKLGYPSGILSRTKKTYDEDAIRIGKCRNGEELTACSEGCNEYKTGKGCANCAIGEKVGVSITCAGEIERYASCGNKDNQYYMHYEISLN